MKAVFLFSTLFVLAFNCGSSQNMKEKQQDVVFVYEVSSRGFFQQTSISKETLVFSEDRTTKQGESYKVSEEDWNMLLGLLNNVEVSEFKNLTSPTNYRAIDGAAIATFRVKINDEVYQTPMFDNGYPPVEIKNLVEKVVKMGAIVVKS
ncbi:MAG: hypothetical protein BM564_11925 [Bacteroidetes bacterium MedPE-SWsnd-G2]|nr:MAG: hypothetical protein BM564_11925 [Bacteroidetes bacterium MedPE-SWsnd-G2]